MFKMKSQQVANRFSNICCTSMLCMLMVGAPVQMVWGDAYSITAVGPNAYCPQPVTPMTNVKQTVLDAIGNMQATGDTLIDLGLAWGGRMISPSWRGQWGGTMDTNHLPMDYGAANMKKAVILLTDGYNNITPNYYGAYDYLSAARLGTNSQVTAKKELDKRTANACTNIKHNGDVLLYVIALDTSSNPIDGTTLAMLQNCATDYNHFFRSPSAQDLKATFKAITDSLSKLRVSK